MTPTLAGRWQTRFFLFITVGFMVTFLFSMSIGFVTSAPWFILFYTMIIGLFWDVLYNFLQTYRWDRDWPPAFQLVAGLSEGIFVWILIQKIGLPFISTGIQFNLFFLHYAFVWLSIFIVSQSVIRIIFVRWRYRGGEWISKEW